MSIEQAGLNSYRGGRNTLANEAALPWKKTVAGKKEIAGS